MFGLHSLRVDLSIGFITEDESGHVTVFDKVVCRTIGVRIVR